MRTPVEIDSRIGFFPVNDSVLPDVITKHCSVSSARYFRKGSIRFGSTTEYRGRENASVEMVNSSPVSLDKKEGVSEVVLNPGLKRKVLIEGFYDVEHETGVNVSNVRLISDIHLLVYCASLGSHSRDRHRRLICGYRHADGSVFQPQACLLHFCEIPTLSFLRAIRDSLPKKVRNENRDQLLVVCGAIDYVKSPILVPTPAGDDYHFNRSSHDATYKGVFEKPNNFSQEEEFRIAIFPFGMEQTPRDVQEFKMESSEIRKCLTRNFRVRPPACG